jgi:hypothetical protein
MNTFQDLQRHLWIIRLTLLLGTLGVARVLPSATVELEQITSDPSAYHDSDVCVTGVTEGDGINFVLFRPPHRQANRSILVVNRQEGSRYRPLDGHWSKICGTVTADDSGLFACKLVLETARPVQRRPIAGRRIFGIFENAGPDTIEIEITNEAEDTSAIMTLRPGDITKTVISPGKGKIFELANDLSRTKLLSTFMLPTVKWSANYFERSTRTFYFSSRGGKVSLLRPNKAATMRERWKAMEKAGE